MAKSWRDREDEDSLKKSFLKGRTFLPGRLDFRNFVDAWVLTASGGSFNVFTVGDFIIKFIKRKL